MSQAMRHVPREREQPNLHQVNSLLLLPELANHLGFLLLQVIRHEPPRRPQVHHLPLRVERQQLQLLTRVHRNLSQDRRNLDAVLQHPFTTVGVLEHPNLEPAAVAAGVVEKTAGLVDAPFGLDGLRQLDPTAPHTVEVDRHNVVGEGNNVEDSSEVP